MMQAGDWPEAMGVYRVYDPVNGESFVGFAHNLRSVYKRLRFELKLNACSYQPLQTFYNERAGAVAFAVLENFTPAPGMSAEETDARLSALLYRHKAALNARLAQVPVR